MAKQRTRVNRLITIPISHYCEKARWALEWCGIPYREQRHLQGFHYLYSFAAARSPSVPVLQTTGETLTDSTDILRWCDARAPAGRKLLPADPGQRREVDELEHSFDEQLGVAGRLWMYTYMLHDVPLVLRYSRIHGVPELELRAMPLLFPFLKGHIHRSLGLRSESRAETKAIVDRAFDTVAERLQERRFLVGESFSAADLTFASLAAAVLIPEGYGVRLPQLAELPEEMRSQVLRWREHPAGRFALSMFEEFRGN